MRLASLSKVNWGPSARTGTSVEGGVSKVTYTDPAQAQDFVTRTGVDTLAVAMVPRGIYQKGMQPELQMHPARYCRTSVDPAWYCTAAPPIRMRKLPSLSRSESGKINISSDMKHAYFLKVREILSKEAGGIGM